MISVKTFTFNALQENTYLLYDNTKECIIIDPGCYEREEKEELKAYIETEGLKPVRLLNTHCHVDHVLGNAFVQRTWKLNVETSQTEAAQLRSVKLYAPVYGFHQYEETEVTIILSEGDILKFGQSELEVLSVPGHSPGHLAFVNKEQKICISGDVLFRNSIGRTDLPGGNYSQLENSIRTKLYKMDDNMVVYPGHGPVTETGYEKRTNPFVRMQVQK